MRVALLSAGSTGDVAPFSGLGHGLAQAGHEVTLVTHGRFAGMAAGAGIGFHTLSFDPYTVMSSSQGQALHRTATKIGKLGRVVSAARNLVAEMAGDLLRAAKSAEVLLVSGTLGPLGHTIAEGFGLPSMGVYLQPKAATGEFCPPLLGTRNFGTTGNRLAGRAVGAAVDSVFAAADRAVRVELGLVPARSGAVRRARERQDWPIHHGFSPLVVPRPGDWRPGLSVAGYWWPHDVFGPVPSELADFLTAGPPPVFVALGSQIVPDPDRVSEAMVTALRAAGLRGVVQRGWSGLHTEGDDMLTVDEVPYTAVFPKMAALIHSGGAGVTAAGLRAGVPAIPVPNWFDHSFWAARLAALGVSPGAVPLRGLASAPLEAVLIRLTADPSYHHRAKELAARLAAEDGVHPVLTAVNRLAGT